MMMPYEWEQHISRFEVYQWLNWTHANTKNLLKQSWRKDNPAYADGYKRAELHDATLNAVESWLQHGAIHPSPNFAIWRDYWLWWAIVMKYGYNAGQFDAPGMDSTFQRWMKQLRLTRDMLLGVQDEPPLDYVSPLAQSLQNMQQVKPEHVAIVGSRNYPHRQHVVDYVNSLPGNTVIVSGGAKGVDSWAENAAKARGMDTLIFPVDKSGLPPYGAKGGKYAFKQAADARNELIVNACDRLVAFHWRASKGTAHSIGLARQQGKDVLVFDGSGSQLPNNFFDEDNDEWREQLQDYNPAA